MTYFKRNDSTGNYEKTVTINDVKWTLIVHADKWSTMSSKYISRWLSLAKIGIVSEFKWGDVQKEGDDQLVEHFSDTCRKCGKMYTTRSGLWKHEQGCMIQLENKREMITANTVNVESGGTQINNTININIRDFGNENPDWLTENVLYSVIGNVNRAIPLLMKRKHFNDKFPENMNVRINTKGDINKRLQVRENGRWRIRDSKQTFYKVVIDIYEILCDALTEDDEIFDGTHPEVEKARKSERFLQKIDRIRPLWEDFRVKMQEDVENPEILGELWEDLKTLLLDRKLCAEQDEI